MKLLIIIFSPSSCHFLSQVQLLPAARSSLFSLPVTFCLRSNYCPQPAAHCSHFLSLFVSGPITARSSLFSLPVTFCLRSNYCPQLTVLTSCHFLSLRSNYSPQPAAHCSHFLSLRSNYSPQPAAHCSHFLSLFVSQVQLLPAAHSSLFSLPVTFCLSGPITAHSSLFSLPVTFCLRSNYCPQLTVLTSCHFLSQVQLLPAAHSSLFSLPVTFCLRSNYCPQLTAHGFHFLSLFVLI